MSKSVEPRLKNLICEGDASNVSLPLQNFSPWPHRSIKHIILETINILKAFECWFVAHIYKEANFIAHNIIRGKWLNVF